MKFSTCLVAPGKLIKIIVLFIQLQLTYDFSSNILNLDGNVIEESSQIESESKSTFFGENFTTGLMPDWSEPSTPCVTDSNDTDPLIRCCNPN